MQCNGNGENRPAMQNNICSRRLKTIPMIMMSSKTSRHWMGRHVAMEGYGVRRCISKDCQAEPARAGQSNICQQQTSYNKVYEMVWAWAWAASKWTKHNRIALVYILRHASKFEFSQRLWLFDKLYLLTCMNNFLLPFLLLLLLLWCVFIFICADG